MDCCKTNCLKKTQEDQPNQEELRNMTELCAAAGVLKRTNEREYVPIKVAYHPYKSTMEFYQLLGSITKAWQKLIFLASRNTHFLEKVYQQISASDPMVTNLIRIKKLKDKNEDQVIFNFTRCDYFVNQQGIPKLIEYNLMSVSMTTHIEKFQQVKKIIDRQNKEKYLKNQPNKALVHTIKSIYDQKQLKGFFLFIIHQSQANIIQQRAIQIQLMRQNIYSKRITLLQAGDQLSLDKENNLLFASQLISFVYFRSGYQLPQYQVNWEKTWKARQTIQLSNAIKIPTITMDLLNQKRMQVQLSKESVYSKYLSSEECEFLKTSLVKYWQFDTIEQAELQRLLKSMQENQNDYVLKPNLEGGGNNYFGIKAYEKLKNSSPQQRKKYIVMQKIYTKTQNNLIVNCQCCQNCVCDYQISRYGVIVGEKDDLKQNKVQGFLIRIKCDTSNQGGIMSGGGSLCAWKIDK